MSFSTRAFVVCAVAAFIQPCIAGYALVDNYTPSNFFDKFTFFTEPDPTNGFVQYVDQSTAQSAGLISQDGSSVKMGVDSTNLAPNGRASVRVTSNKIYNQGLIILDVEHMPVGCGTWPAFWTVGPEWPSNGEIDIIEGVNTQAANQMTLHTGPDCSITNDGLFSGNIVTPNCDVNAYGQVNNAGCSIGAENSGSYGEGLNAGNGGVYATEWTSEGISIYFFPRSSIPHDITSGKPNPGTWGRPYANFQGGCDLSNSFKDQQIVFDTTLCGDWAGGAWGGDGTCSAKSSSCEDYVANNPSAFQDAYWQVNSLKVFQNGNGTVEMGPKVHGVNAGPTGIVGTLPPAFSSLAPIPVSTQNIAMTYGAPSIPAASPSAPWNTWNTWAASPVGAALDAAPTASYPPFPASSSYPPAASSWVPTPTFVNAAAVTPAPLPSSSYPAVSPVSAAWFPDGSDSGGIPANAVVSPVSVVSGYQVRRHARHMLAHKNKRRSHSHHAHVHEVAVADTEDELVHVNRDEGRPSASRFSFGLW